MARARIYPCREVFLRYLDYDAKKGHLYHKNRTPDDFKSDDVWRRKQVCGTWNTRWGGKRADFEHVNGYSYVHMMSNRYLTHRVIWILENGNSPDIIDHLNHNKLDNRIRNLRSVDHSHNHRNRAPTGRQPGIRWKKDKSKYQARICVRRKELHLGYFDTYNQAVIARQAAEKRYGFITAQQSA